MSDVLARLGISDNNPGGFDGEWIGSGESLEVTTPIDGSRLATVTQITADEYERIAARAQEAFESWRTVPAPIRGDLIRQLGNALRQHKEDLGMLVTTEMGKILPEGKGEVQEMIDICDFAVGLSRQLYGMTTHSERPMHRMYEQWHPLGVVAIISAFNFPVAVWSWNAALAAVCGDSCLWKPSHTTPLTALAVTKIAQRVCEANDVDPAIFSLACGSHHVLGDTMLNDQRIRLISATGSCRMGEYVGKVAAARYCKTILELGGNNAVIVTPNADLEMAMRAILFGAVGTAGQRCTSTRRIILHKSIKDRFLKSLLAAYEKVTIGDPRKDTTLMGPLVNHQAVTDMQNAIAAVKQQGGQIIYGGEPLDGADYPGGHYVKPCIAEVKNDFPIVQDETFAPILYAIEYGGAAAPTAHDDIAADVRAAIAIQNGVPQGLSSSIFTTNMIESEEFLAATGSDCGIANVNIGTSGAEIGGAFGGEKDTGGGRESGSDSWKLYMRRQTNTINYGSALPLAQGIKFGD